MKIKFILIGIISLFIAETSHSAAKEVVREGGKLMRRIIMTGSRPRVNQHKMPLKTLKTPIIPSYYKPVGDGELLVKVSKIRSKN